MKLPQEFLKKMQQLLGEEFTEFVRSYNEPRTTGLRVNRLKITADVLEKNLLYLKGRVPWCNDGFYYDDQEFRPAKSPYYYAGLYYIQEPSAMLPAEMLDVKHTDKVLDLCAAPGGKSIQLAGKITSGLIVVNDINFGRAKVLLKNIERYGVRNAVVLNETPERIVNVFKNYFDKILVDAPCSGEGMFHKEPDMAKDWSQDEVLKYARWQEDILDVVPALVRSGGTIVYSTCTFSQEENEWQIENFLKKHKEFAVDKMSRIWPHKAKGEGHFVARIKNTANYQEYDGNPLPLSTVVMSSSARKAIADFSLQVWGDKQRWQKYIPSGGTLVERDEHILWEKDCLPSLKGLKVLRSGWLLGTLEKGRFKPSQAFAMGLDNEAVKAAIQRVDFSAENHAVIRYLRGETIQKEGKMWDKGWYLITVDDFPLGWAKGGGYSLKNEYPPGWRWQDGMKGRI